MRLDIIAESIFNEATKKYENLFNAIDLLHSNDYMGLLFTETNTNSSACQNIINFIKDKVKEGYSDVFDVNIERTECDEEFPDDIADIEVGLNWRKIFENESGKDFTRHISDKRDNDFVSSMAVTQNNHLKHMFECHQCVNMLSHNPEDVTPDVCCKYHGKHCEFEKRKDAFTIESGWI